MAITPRPLDPPVSVIRMIYAQTLDFITNLSNLIVHGVVEKDR